MKKKEETPPKIVIGVGPYISRVYGSEVHKYTKEEMKTIRDQIKKKTSESIRFYE